MEAFSLPGEEGNSRIPKWVDSCDGRERETLVYMNNKGSNILMPIDCAIKKVSYTATWTGHSQKTDWLTDSPVYRWLYVE